MFGECFIVCDGDYATQTDFTSFKRDPEVPMRACEESSRLMLTAAEKKNPG